MLTSDVLYHVRTNRDDFRGLAQFVCQRVHNHDAVVFFPDINEVGFSYYAEPGIAAKLDLIRVTAVDAERKQMQGVPVDQEPWILRNMAQDVFAHARVWLLLDRGYLDNRQYAEAMSLFSPRMRPRQTWKFRKKLDLYLIERLMQNGELREGGS